MHVETPFDLHPGQHTGTTESADVDAFGDLLTAAGWAVTPWPQWTSPDGQWRVEAYGGDADNGNRRRAGVTLSVMYVVAHRRTVSPDQGVIWPGIIYHHADSAEQAIAVLRAAGVPTEGTANA